MSIRNYLTAVLPIMYMFLGMHLDLQAGKPSKALPHVLVIGIDGLGRTVFK